MGIMARFSLSVLFIAMGLMLNVSSASASAIVCGDCHSVTDGPLDGDNCAGDARGLHGTHNNYSSSLLQPGDNKCDYCHSAVASTAPTALHNNNYVNVTTTTEAPSLSWEGTGATCTDACHNNNATTAPWGNYTSPSVALSCAACHDDSSDNTGLSGAHVAHLGTAITVTGLGASDNSDCDACHPDNTADLFSAGMADDGSVKAYPHASDGTNVSTDAAAVDAGLSATRGAGATDTCANACHSNATSDQWGATSLSCNSCHYYSSGTIMGGSHNTHVVTRSISCSACHSVPAIGDTSHVTALPAVDDNATIVLATGTWNDMVV
jgi:ferredoxin